MILDDIAQPEGLNLIIEKFEVYQDNIVSRRMVSDTGHSISFDEINVSKTDGWEAVHNFVFSNIQYYTQVYRSYMEIPNYAWPEEIAYEHCRMKRYLPNGQDRFDEHADVRDHATARRFLVMFAYLNTVEEGGETAFYFNDVIIKVSAVAGRIIAFPPFWTHPHAGLSPISGNKYIIGSYLHYT